MLVSKAFHNIFGYAYHKLKISSIREKMFQWSMKGNGIEVTVP